MAGFLQQDLTEVSSEDEAVVPLPTEYDPKLLKAMRQALLQYRYTGPIKGYTQEILEMLAAMDGLVYETRYLYDAEHFLQYNGELTVAELGEKCAELVRRNLRGAEEVAVATVEATEATGEEGGEDAVPVVAAKSPEYPLFHEHVAGDEGASQQLVPPFRALVAFLKRERATAAAAWREPTGGGLSGAVPTAGADVAEALFSLVGAESIGSGSRGLMLEGRRPGRRMEDQTASQWLAAVSTGPHALPEIVLSEDRPSIDEICKAAAYLGYLRSGAEPRVPKFAELPYHGMRTAVARACGRVRARPTGGVPARLSSIRTEL